MRTQETVASVAPVPAPASRWREYVPDILTVCVVAGLLALFFIGLYGVRRYPWPIGWDTPRYLGQTAFVAQRGLAHVPTTLPFPSSTLASRAGFPVVVLSLASIMHTSTFMTAAMVAPAVAVAIALASGAFVSWSLRGDRRTLAVVALIVGVSPALIRLFAPETYTDNMFALALVAAALIPVLSYTRDGRGLAAAVILLGAAGVAHGPFFLVTLAIMGVVALSFAPASWRAWRAGDARALATPAGRLATVIAGAVAVTAATILGLLRVAPDTPSSTRSELVKKFREDIPIYWFPLTLPLAAVGAAAVAGGAGLVRRSGEIPSGTPLLASEDRARFAARFVLRLFLAWTLVTIAGLAMFLFGGSVPAHRFLAFLLPLPILVAVGVLSLSGVGRRLAGRVSLRRGTAAAAAIVLAGVGLMAGIGAHDLYATIARDRGVEWISTPLVQDAATANAYLDAAGVPASAPVVFVMDDPGLNPLATVPERTYVMRSVLPPDRVVHAYVYLGTPENYLAGRPTLRARPAEYDETEGEFWPGVRRLLPRHPVALLLAGYNPAYARVASEHPEWVVGPGVVALGGGAAGTTVTAGTPPVGPRTVAAGAGYGVGTFAMFALIGLGWAVALLPAGTRGIEALATAPAFGIGLLILSGVMIDSIGLRLSGAGGALAVLLPMAVGGGLAVRRIRRAGPLVAVFPPA